MGQVRGGAFINGRSDVGRRVPAGIWRATTASPSPHTGQVKPHFVVSATATRNRVFILSLAASARQWKKHSADLLAIQKTFSVKRA